MSLLSYVQSFRIQAPTGRIVAGTPIELLAQPTEILDVPDVEVISGPVNLTAVLKHVQLPPENGLTPWPAPAAATHLASVTSGLSSAPPTNSIEAWVANISGTVPVGIRDISSQIRIDLRWRFTAVGDEPAPRPRGHRRLDDGAVAPGPLTASDGHDPGLGDIAVVGGALDASAVTIAIPPLFTELATADFQAALDGAPVTRRIGVQLSVRGRIGTTQDTGEVLIPATPLQLQIIPIPLPSFAALFRDQELTGDAVLVTVPKASPFANASQLLGVLAPLKGLLGKVNTAAAVTAWATGTGGIHAAVSTLADRLPLTTHVGFKAEDSFKDLGKYNFISRDWKWDTDIEDRGSSALVVSPARPISFFQHDAFGGHELTLDAVPRGFGRLGGAVVRHLHVNVPESVPPGCALISGSPGGGWGDKISSFRWHPVPG